MVDTEGHNSSSHTAYDRRADHRTATVFRPVLIESEGFAGFCLVRNLSPNGLMGEVYTEFAKGLPVSIQFSQDQFVKSRVVWSKSGRIGIQFDEAIDLSEVLESFAKSKVEGKINRAPRVQLRCQGTIMIADRALAVDVLDVSQRGLKVQSSFVRAGDEGIVQLEGLEPRKATVRWTQDGIAGLNFLRPLRFEDLAAWVIRHQIEPVEGHARASSVRPSA